MTVPDKLHRLRTHRPAAERRQSQGPEKPVHLRDSRHLELELASFGSYRGFDEGELGTRSSCR